MPNLILCACTNLPKTFILIIHINSLQYIHNRLYQTIQATKWVSSWTIEPALRLRTTSTFSLCYGITRCAGNPFSAVGGTALAFKRLHVFIQECGVIEG